MRDNQFSKLKKAIKSNDKIAILRGIVNLKILARHPARARKAVTRGVYIRNEINRALRNLGQDGNWTPQLKEAFEIARARAGEDIWNEVIYKAPEEKPAEVAVAPAVTEEVKANE